MASSLSKTDVALLNSLPASRRDALLDDVRRALGAYPYNGTNPCYNDGWYWSSLQGKYSDFELAAATKTVQQEQEKVAAYAKKVIRKRHS